LWLSTTVLVAGSRWFFWSEDADPGDGGFVVLLRLHRWEATNLGPRQHETFPGQHAIAAGASLHAAGLFIDSHSLFGNGAFSYLAMVEAPRLLQRSSWRRWSWRRRLATVVAGNTSGHFVFLDLLGFYLQIQDNYFIPICLLVSTCVNYYNWIFN
jgi:hypothetical protein